MGGQLYRGFHAAEVAMVGLGAELLQCSLISEIASSSVGKFVQMNAS